MTLPSFGSVRAFRRLGPNRAFVEVMLASRPVSLGRPWLHIDGHVIPADDATVDWDPQTHRCRIEALIPEVLLDALVAAWGTDAWAVGEEEEGGDSASGNVPAA